MKQKLLLSFLLFTFFYYFAQAQKTINGTVVCNEMALEKIDVVNLNSKKISTTDSQGNFSIEAKANDVLFILSKDYYDIKVTITAADFLKDRLRIALSKKPIELDEVTINKVEKVNVIVSPEEIAMSKIAKFESAPKTVGVYTGEMPYGMDFVGLFKKIFKSNKKKDKKETPRFANFKEYTFFKINTDDFIYNNLGIKREELDLFMVFCESDSNYKAVMEREDTLETMEFLTAKSELFKKLER